MADERFPDLPMPLDVLDGKYVIASVWGNDDANDGAVWCTLLMMQHSTPFYAVEEVTWTGEEWTPTVRTSFDNIVPAIEDYKDRGGDI